MLLSRSMYQYPRAGRALSGALVVAALAGTLITAGCSDDAAGAGTLAGGTAPGSIASTTHAETVVVDIGADDLSGIDWSLGDIGAEDWFRPGRAGRVLCERRGYLGGYLTGYYQGSRQRLVCFRVGARRYTIGRTDLLDYGYGPDDLDFGRAGYYRVNQIADDVCVRRGHVSGFFDSYDVDSGLGLLCIDEGALRIGVSSTDLVNLGLGISDFGGLRWGRSNLAAYELCQRRGYTSGRYAGFAQLGNYQVVCYQ